MKQSPLLEVNSCSDALYVQKSMLKVLFHAAWMLSMLSKSILILTYHLCLMFKAVSFLPCY